MILPPQITFRNVPHSDAVEAKIHRKVEKLNRFFDGIMACRVAIESPHGHRQGNVYHIRIDLTVPGEELVVKRDPSLHAAHEDIYVAIRDAFDAARRQLQDYIRRKRGVVKMHEEPRTFSRGFVSTLFPEESYGFIETQDGREIYFHENSISNGGFEHMEIGTEVLFVEEEGEKGPRASMVKPISRHSAR